MGRPDEIFPVLHVGDVPAVGADALDLHLQIGMLGFGLRVARGRSRIDGQIGRHDAFQYIAIAHGIDQRRARFAERTVYQHRRTALAGVQRTVGGTRQRLVGAIQTTVGLGQRPARAVLRLDDRSAVLLRIVGRIARSVGRFVAVASRLMTAHQSAAELVAADRRVARPVQTDGHPRLRTAVARHVCLDRIGRHLRIGHAVGRRHALPRPGHRIEIDREPAHAVDVDVGAGG